MGFSITLLPALLLILLFFLLLLFLPGFFLLLKQIDVDAHALKINAEVRMMVSNLPFAKIKALVKIFESRELNSFLGVI